MVNFLCKRIETHDSKNNLDWSEYRNIIEHNYYKYISKH